MVAIDFQDLNVRKEAARLSVEYAGLIATGAHAEQAFSNLNAIADGKIKTRRQKLLFVWLKEKVYY